VSRLSGISSQAGRGDSLSAAMGKSIYRAFRFL
jgi:hypothetical protein